MQCDRIPNLRHLWHVCSACSCAINGAFVLHFWLFCTMNLRHDLCPNFQFGYRNQGLASLTQNELYESGRATAFTIRGVFVLFVVAPLVHLVLNNYINNPIELLAIFCII
jgi:hypothetical protein